MARRAALLVSALLALCVAAPAAQADCGARILSDYLTHGAVSGRYPPACYRQALVEMPGDVRAYSNAQSALQAAMARDRAVTTVPPAAAAPVLTAPAGALAAIGPRSGSDVPTAALLAAGLVLVVVATGATGIVARRRTRGDRPR